MGIIFFKQSILIVSFLLFWPVAAVQFVFCILLNIFYFISRGFRFHLSYYVQIGDLSSLHRAIVCENRNVDEKTGFGQTAMHGIFFNMNYRNTLSVINTRMIDFLVKMGADVNVLDVRKWSPLAYAISGNYTEEAKYLIDTTNVLINKKLYKNQTALHYAVKYNNVHLVRHLIAKGAHIEAVNNYGMTPIHYAKNSDIIDLFEAELKKKKAV